MACAIQAGLSSLDDDCDDTLVSVFPGANEICDGIDNNCDSFIDEDDPNLVTTYWYIDNDDDGYGVAQNPLLLSDCAVPVGYALYPTDCNDDESDISPGNVEICHDDIDNDCDQEADCNDGDCQTNDMCALSWEICTDALDHNLNGNAAFDYFGAASTSIGDVNGDGFDDFAISAYGNGDAGPSTGKVYVFFGGAFDETTTLSDANCTFEGEHAFDQAGWSLAGGGDIDGDGKGDVLIGAPDYDHMGSDSGVVYLIYGSSMTGLCDVNLADSDVLFYGESSGDKAGESIAFADDIDGDGRSEILIGAPNNDDAGSFG